MSNPSMKEDKVSELPEIFESVQQAISALKLDRRHKWEEFNGELVYPQWYTAQCSGCSEYDEGSYKGSSGCHECGYTGKRRNVVPIAAFMPNGSIVKVKIINHLIH